ncbi:hypothetical protein [Undibacterium rugosum]|uniref:FlxA-like protein n=1 Tax=Undibacterium rugosum TaxID=2762291 RepID=A0A923KU87_9BURK|nr:hypothetical protein [Undibacterium rugosum]MBC3936844.1 hypothetical protein [Undibacterium rugosum]MBR7780175.1 hypothetical protein [Undibacterium rugosum]
MNIGSVNNQSSQADTYSNSVQKLRQRDGELNKVKQENQKVKAETQTQQAEQATQATQSADALQQARAAQENKPKPSVNGSGQVVGRMINTSA